MATREEAPIMPVLTEKPSLADSSEYSSGPQNKSGEEEMAAVPISTILGSKIFTVLVGADGHELAVHECALSRSPVLQRFCRGGFLEATTGRIELKDDDPEIFDKVLGYLYRGDYQPYMPHASLRPGNNSPSAKSVVPRSTTGLDDKYAIDSAMVYIMADKYQLPGLKKVAVRKINGLQPLSHDAFLKISSYIYAAVPESDRIFRDFFIEHAPDQLRNASQAELTPYVRAGGAMAEDTVHVILAERRDYAKESKDFWRRLYDTSTVAKVVFRKLNDLRTINQNTGNYETSAASVVRHTNHGLKEVRAAAEELKNLGLLVPVGSVNGVTEPGDELLGFNNCPLAIYVPGECPWWII